ncbi:MAG: hypothetical protein NTW60_00475 [Candidatus Wolfebacteria bacterium]|nr:hypothetical protein [Candidatus Wolfebacteria bacterium]
MEPVYYRTKSGALPVKEYLSRYSRLKKDQDKKVTEKLRKFFKIKSVIKHATENNGIAGGEFSSPLLNYPFQEFRIPENDRVVRILYFCYERAMLVLLNAFDKPKIYEKGKQHRKNEKEYKVTKCFYDDFVKNPNQYEKFEQ